MVRFFFSFSYRKGSLFGSSHSLVDRERYENEFFHGQAKEKITTWCGCCRAQEEPREVVMSHSHISDEARAEFNQVI